MSGFFGCVSRKDCVADVFYGTDYHSHLGTDVYKRQVSAGVFSDKDVDNTEKGDEGYDVVGKVLYRPYLNGKDVIHIGAVSYTHLYQTFRVFLRLGDYFLIR